MITELASGWDPPSMNVDCIGENVLISILAVNRWTADRVFSLTDRFRAVGLLDFAAISELPIEDIAERLARAGYARGEYMNQLLGTRVLSMATVLSATELARLKQCLVEGRTTDVSETLRGIKGVGPIVLETFWSLQNTD
jgi:hypothetical protein